MYEVSTYLRTLYVVHMYVHRTYVLTSYICTYLVHTYEVRRYVGRKYISTYILHRTYVRTATPAGHTKILFLHWDQCGSETLLFKFVRHLNGLCKRRLFKAAARRMQNIRNTVANFARASGQLRAKPPVFYKHAARTIIWIKKWGHH